MAETKYQYPMMAVDRLVTEARVSLTGCLDIILATDYEPDYDARLDLRSLLLDARNLDPSLNDDIEKLFTLSRSRKYLEVAENILEIIGNNCEGDS